MPVLYVVACAAPPAQQLTEEVETFRAEGWTVCVLVTPAALAFVDRDAVAEASGFPVRCEPRRPGEADPFPLADAVVVAPLTFNTVNKWALGLSDNTAVGVLHELLGSGVPIIAAVWAKEALRRHPAFEPSMEILISAGVRFIELGSGPDGFPWSAVRSKLSTLDLV